MNNMENIFSPSKQKKYFNWKGKTFSQITSKIQKNAGIISIPNNDNHNIFNSNPLKIYRREIIFNNTNLICNPRTSIKIDELNRPNGYILHDHSSNWRQNGDTVGGVYNDNNLGIVLDINLSNNTYELLNNNCSNDNICFNSASNALKRVRSSSGIIKKNYYTSNKQYLFNRKYFIEDNNTNNNINQGEPIYNGGNILFQNNNSNIKDCKQYIISNELQNNFFSYLWIDGTRHDVILPNGIYDTERLNNEFKLIMIINRHYYINIANQTKEFLLKIIYNSLNNTIQLQCILNNFYCNNNDFSIPKVYLLIGNNTVPWSNDFNYKNILPVFYIPMSFSNVIGFNEGYYPNNPSSNNNYYINSNNNHIINNTTVSHSSIPQRQQIYYKPNNTQFSQQGPVNSSILINRKKYDTITEVGLLLRTIKSINLSNSLAYNIANNGSIKNGDKPFPILCKKTLEKMIN